MLIIFLLTASLVSFQILNRHMQNRWKSPKFLILGLLLSLTTLLINTVTGQKINSGDYLLSTLLGIIISISSGIFCFKEFLLENEKKHLYLALLLTLILPVIIFADLLTFLASAQPLLYNIIRPPLTPSI